MSYTIVGEQIQKFRKEKGLTQKELGERIGVTSSAVSQWESGGTPDISLLPAISDVLGVTVDALFGRTEARREDMEETVGKYIASLPEEKRLERLVSLMRGAAFYVCADRVADIVDFKGGDSEMICIAEDGFAASVLSGGQSFLSAAWCGEGGFAGLLSSGQEAARLFSVLSSPDALTMLSRLYSESPKHRTAGVLAKLAEVGRSEAEEILRRFLELKLINELELETEDGCTKAYAANLNGAVVPLLVSACVSARLMTDKAGGFRLINDARDRQKGEK